MFAVPEVRRLTFDRRVKVEDVVWDRLQAHGVAAEDLGARAAVATVMSLAFLGLALWASSDDDEPLLAVMARCSVGRPSPVAAGGGGDRRVPRALTDRTARKVLAVTARICYGALDTDSGKRA